MNPEIRQNRILRIPLTCLSILGLVTFNDQRLRLLNRIKGYIVITTFALYNATEIVLLVLNRNDVNVLTINGGTTALYFTIWIKAWASLNYETKFREMYSFVHQNMKNIEEGKDEDSKKILDDYVGRCLKVIMGLQANMVFTCAFFAMYLIIICWIFHEPGEAIRPIIAETWLPFKTEDNILPTFLFYIYICFLDVLLIPQWNAMIICLLVYVTCMFQMLKYKLRNRDEYILKTRQGKYEGSISQEERYKFIVDRIDEHLIILKFLEDLKAIINFPMGVDFVIFVLILCGQAYLGSEMKLGFESSIVIGYLLTILLLALLYYWYANEVALEGEDLALAAYESSWIDDNSAYRHAIKLMIQRSNRLVTLKAGLFPMNLATYITMLRISYSAFTILRQVSD